MGTQTTKGNKSTTVFVCYNYQGRFNVKKEAKKKHSQTGGGENQEREKIKRTHRRNGKKQREKTFQQISVRVKRQEKRQKYIKKRQRHRATFVCVCLGIVQVLSLTFVRLLI